jgi:hypothetical protein
MFDAERIAGLPRDYVIRSTVPQADALDGPQFEENCRNSLYRSFAAWTRIPMYDFQSGSLFWPSTQRRMNHYYYGRQNRTRPKKLPRPLLEEHTPEDVVASKKHQAKVTVGDTPKRSRTRLDLLTTPATWQRDVDSGDDMEAMALANTVVPETAMSDMCG